MTAAGSRMPAHLQQAYIAGKVAPRIGWGTSGAGRRCYAQAAKHGVPAHMRWGMCQNLAQKMGLHIGRKGRGR